MIKIIFLCLVLKCLGDYQWVEIDNTIQYISVDYTVCGKVSTMGEYEIDIQDDQFFSLVITDGFASPNEQKTEYFTISVCNIELPWVLDKPFPKPIQTMTVEKINVFKRLFKRKYPIEKNPKQCLENIKIKLAAKTGISKCVDLGETSAAFSGTIDNYDLNISLDILKK